METNQMQEKLIGVTQQALMQYGVSTQAIKMCEECGELIVALAKFISTSATGNKVNDNPHYNSVCEELADVFIVMTQLTYLFDTGKFIDTKLDRLAKMIDYKPGPAQD